MGKPLISIVIPTFNRYNELRETLNSLKSQSFSDFEVVIADDGSSDETPKIKKEKYPFNLVYTRQDNAGRAAARNLGVSKASGDIIIFIDDHIIVDRHFVEEHYKAHQKWFSEGVEVIRGRVEFIKDPQDAPKNPPKPKFRWLGINENNPFVVFITNNISVTKSALELCGGFDPDFKEYGFQDQELGYRLRQRGIKFKINPKAVGYIFGVKALDTQQRLNKHLQAGRSAALFYRKHFWGGLQIGVNPFNLFFYKLTNSWLMPFYRRKMEQCELKNPKKFDKWFYRLRHMYFLRGIAEGLQKYKPGEFLPHSNNKVVMLVSHQADLSGAPISLVILANQLPKKGYLPVIVFPQKGPVLEKVDRSKVRILIQSRWNRYLSLQLFMARFRPGIVHANTVLTEYALDLAKKFGFKKILHVREDLSRLPKLAKRLSDKADRIILISHSMVKDFPDPFKLDVVYNSLADIPKDNITRAEEPYNLLFIGTIEKRKGLLDLVKAVKMIYENNKRVSLTVLGKVLPAEKWYYRQIQKFIKQNALQDLIKFEGVQKDVNPFIDRATIVVVPSLAEPFGRVVIEAMARKKIVLATNVGGIPEIITNYDNGFLVNPGKPEELAKAIQYIWAKPEEQKNRIREQAAKSVIERFTPERYVDGVLEVYNKVMYNFERA